MSKDFPQIHKHMQELMGELGKEIPETLSGFSTLHHAAIAEGALDVKTKELLSLAIAIVIRCEGCIAFHVHDALKAGASREEINETIGVAILMGGGPAVMYGVEAFEAMEQFKAVM